MIKHHVCSYPAQTAGNIVENLKIEARADELLVDEDLINFANGTLNISDALDGGEALLPEQTSGGIHRR